MNRPKLMAIVRRRIEQIAADRFHDAEQQAGRERAGHAADAGHDHDDQRLQRVFDADGGAEGDEGADQHAGRRRPARRRPRRRARRYFRTSTPTRLGRDRIDGDRPQRRAEAGVAQHQEQRRGQDAGAEERHQPVQRDVAPSDMHAARQEAVAAQVAAPVHQRQALEDEEQAEGDEHDVGVEHILVRRAADQRDHQELIDQPVQRRMRSAR